MHQPDMATAPTCHLARFAAARSKDRFGDAAMRRASGTVRRLWAEHDAAPAKGHSMLRPT